MPRSVPHRPSRLRPAAVLATVVIGLVWLGPAACDDGAVEGVVAPGNDLAPRVLDFCAASMARMDCDCFWDEAQAAFNAGNVDDILVALAERDRYGPMITRGRLEKVAGEDQTRVIGRALYDCVDLKGG